MLRVFQKAILAISFSLITLPVSAMFIQADWLDPTQPSVGTNRYAYSFNDPVNLIDPGGNLAEMTGGIGGWGDDYGFWMTATTPGGSLQSNEGIQDAFNFGTSTSFVFDPSYYDMSTSMDVVDQIKTSFSSGGRVAIAAENASASGAGAFSWSAMGFNAGPNSDHWAIGRYSGSVQGNVYVSPSGRVVAAGTVAINPDFFSWKADGSGLAHNLGIAALSQGINSPGPGNMFTSPGAAVLLETRYGAQMAPPAPMTKWMTCCAFSEAVRWRTPSPAISALARPELAIEYNRPFMFAVTLSAPPPQ